MRALGFIVAALGCCSVYACSSDGGDDEDATAPLSPGGASGIAAGGTASVGAAANGGTPPAGTPPGNDGGGNSSGGAASGGTSAGGPSTGGAPAGSAGAAPAPVPSGPLPDLVLDAAYLLDTTIEDQIETDDVCLMNEGCVTGLGQRRVVRFGTRTGNLGTAAFLLGSPDESNPLWTFDSCHEAFELVGFARYELLDATTGALVLTGVKQGFCMRDSEPWELEGGPGCRDYDCTRQGIAQGCADNYGSELQCQWVDITDVPSGAYTLRVVINYSQQMPELDYSNNAVTIDLQITDDAVQVGR